MVLSEYEDGKFKEDLWEYIKIALFILKDLPIACTYTTKFIFTK